MSQNERLLTALQAGPITPLEAIARLGIYRLGARVLDLRHKGHSIHTDIVEVANRSGGVSRFARYSLTATARQ